MGCACSTALKTKKTLQVATERHRVLNIESKSTQTNYSMNKELISPIKIKRPNNDYLEFPHSKKITLPPIRSAKHSRSSSLFSRSMVEGVRPLIKPWAVDMETRKLRKVSMDQVCRIRRGSSPLKKIGVNSSNEGLLHHSTGPSGGNSKVSGLSKFGKKSLIDKKFTLNSIKSPLKLTSNLSNSRNSYKGQDDQKHRMLIPARKTYQKTTIAQILIQKSLNTNFPLNFSQSQQQSPIRKRSRNTISTNDSSKGWERPLLLKNPMRKSAQSLNRQSNLLMLLNNKQETVRRVKKQVLN